MSQRAEQRVVALSMGAREPDLAAYSGPWPIDHLETALSAADEAAAWHFFDTLLPLPETHDTVAAVLCRTDADDLLLELLANGFRPAVDRVLALIQLSVAAGATETTRILLDLAHDRGIALDHLAPGWVNALATHGNVGDLIRQLHRHFPDCAREQALACALEAGHPDTLHAIVDCLTETRIARSERQADGGATGPRRVPRSSLPQVHQQLIGSILIECVDRLTATSASVVLSRGLDPMLRVNASGSVIEQVCERASDEVRRVFGDWVDGLATGKAMNAHILMGDYEAFAACCEAFDGHCPDEFDAQAALVVAVSRNHAALANVLLMLGARPDRADSHGVLPLLEACTSGAGDCVNLLLKAGADPDLPLHDGHDCGVTIAASRGHPRIVQALLLAGAEASRFDSRGNTALHYCVARGDIELCARLLRAGLPIDVKTLRQQLTPLAVACVTDKHRESNDVVRFLLDMGADIDACDRTGRTPLTLARLNRQMHVQRILEERGGRARGQGLASRLPRLETMPRHIRLCGLEGVSGVVLATRRIMARLERSQTVAAVDDEERDFDRAA